MGYVATFGILGAMAPLNPPMQWIMKTIIMLHNAARQKEILKNKIKTKALNEINLTHFT